MIATKKTKGNLLFICICGFCRFSTGAFCRKSGALIGKNGRLKLGEPLNVVGHIGNKQAIFCITAFQTLRLFVDSLGRINCVELEVNFVFILHAKIDLIST